jgi:hypothetical protein
VEGKERLEEPCSARDFSPLSLSLSFFSSLLRSFSSLALLSNSALVSSSNLYNRRKSFHTSKLFGVEWEAEVKDMMEADGTDR